MLTRRALLATLASPLAAQQATTVHERILDELEHAPLSMRFTGSTPDDVRAWERRFRSKLAELLGPHRPPARWDAVSVERAELDDHSRELFLFRAQGLPELPVWILTPKGRSGKRPGVVALHGHGPFGHDAVAGVDTTPERKEDIEKFHYDYGRQLAKRGYVVATPCFTPFGRRLDDRKRYGGDDACAVSFLRLQILGKVLMAENLRDALWSFEALRQHDQVDPERIGCVGLSYGGRMTMLTSAMEERIRVAVCSGALNVMQERMRVRYSCGAQVIPGLLEYGDVPEIAGLIAPRPAVWEVGSRDGLMAKDWIEPAWERIERVYSAAGVADRLIRDDFDGAHQWSGAKAHPLLESVLRP
ncbi:MAG: acetylxylan esterase [Acidobacteria bacterium]|nr:acetylxylan esterase [Acidobacteriota bacterium]